MGVEVEHYPQSQTMWSSQFVREIERIEKEKKEGKKTKCVLLSENEYINKF